MTVYGPTPEGWFSKPTSVVLDEIQADYLAILGNSAGTDAGSIPLDSLAGQEIVILTDAIGALWDLLQAVAASFDANTAVAAQLDSVCSLTGTTRENATFSTSTVICTGVPGTILNVGRVVKTSDTAARFDSTAPATIAALTAWQGNHAYVLGNQITNGGNAYQCTTAGTSAGSGGPTTTATDIVDNSAHWRFLGIGTGAVSATFEAEAAGPIGALLGTLTVIATPVDGWRGAINMLDAIPGALQENDPALRARREAELAGQGGSTRDAIRAKILKVNEASADPAHQPPTTCRVFYNDTDITDGDGLPPHSVEILVRNGTDQDITQAIWNAVGAGTNTVGNQTGTALDSQGNSQVVHWSRPVLVPIYVTATIEYDASQWPVAGADALVVQAALSALLTFGLAFPIGVDVRQIPLGTGILRGPSATDANGNAIVPAPLSSVAAPGLLDVSPLTFGLAPAPATSTPISISTRQLAVFDSSRCVLTAVATVP